MTVTITQQHNEDRLRGTLANLERGAGPARLRIYPSPRPALASDAPGVAPLAEFVLLDPPGEVTGNELVLSLPPDAVVLANGTAVWARFVTGEGNNSTDCDVSDPAGSGEVKVASTSLVVGGSVRVVSAKFT